MPRPFLQKVQGMAWWTHLLIFGRDSEIYTNAYVENKNLPASLYRALRRYIRRRLIDILYRTLRVFTYVYLVLSVLIFFVSEYLPSFIVFLVDAFAEPYLGVIGVYIIVKEIGHRRGLIPRHKKHEGFVLMWLIFSLISSVAVFVSDYYVLNEHYKNVVTTTLATMIIRLSNFLRWL